ncbi:hypothetical protein GGR52DRAFT_575485 [Hypoxylon sp. FL1284]|nr:hypothetical protein GGR52DRAFT_575485 [Hypoxylon sp. FL1284]
MSGALVTAGRARFSSLLSVMYYFQIWSLHLTLLRKIAIAGIFLLGGMAIGAAAVGYRRLRDANQVQPRPDYGREQVRVDGYVLVDHRGGTLIAACLLATQHLFRGRSIGSVVASMRSDNPLPNSTSSIQKPAGPKSLAGKSSGVSHELGVEKSEGVK